MFYSVPYEFIKHKVDVRITRAVVEVFFQNSRICSHARLQGREGQYSTVTDHMPEEHRKYAQWNAHRFISWAASVGPNTEVVIKAILATHKVEQQGYRSCNNMLRLAEKYPVERIEAACQKALGYTPSPSYKNVQTILKSGHDQVLDRPEKKDQSEHGFVRGAKYYGGEGAC